MSVNTLTQTWMVGTVYADGRGAGLQPTTRITRVVNRPDPVRRVKPSKLIIKNGTAHSLDGYTVQEDLVVEKGMGGSPPVSYVSYSLVYQHGGLGTWSEPLFSTQTVYNRKYNQMLAEARTLGVNLANMLGEYKQTAKLFPSLVGQFASLTKAVIKRDPRILIYGHEIVRKKGRVVNGRFYARNKAGALNRDVPQKSLDFLANQWLQYIYGVKPLMSDCEEIMKTLKAAVAEKPLIQRVSVGGTERSRRQYTVNSTLSPGVKCLFDEEASYKVQFYADIVFKNETLNAMLGNYGFTNPVALAWELLPFSFVIDWWINVGETLESLDNALYINTNESYYQVTIKKKQKRTVKVLGSTGSFEKWSRSRGAPAQLTFPVARLRYKPSASLIHAANGSALLWNIATSVLGSRR